MKYVVLGHTGFVGKNLTKHLLGNGHEVICISSEECDLRDYSRLNAMISAAGEVGAIFNCAANVGSVHYVTAFAGDVISDNTYIALNLYKAVLENCPSTPIVNLLSNCCYVDGPQIQEEEKWLDGTVHPSVFSFGNFKRVLYYISRCYEMQYNINSINLMFSGIYGPGDSTDPNKVHALNGMIIRMLESIENNDAEFEIWGTGSPIREWIYIEDVCKILLESIKIDKLIEPVNIAQGKGFTIAPIKVPIGIKIIFTASCINLNMAWNIGATFNALPIIPIKTLATPAVIKILP